MPISKQDLERIVVAIEAVERRTSGEIVCVLARASSAYAYAPALWAAVVALAIPGPLIVFTGISAAHIYFIQIATFFLLAALLSIPAIRFALVPRQAKRARAHRAALHQFFTRRVSRTRNQNGVLIYVSLAERYARIVVDDGIAAKVAPEDWQAAVDRLTASIREGAVGDGFVAAIDLCGEHLIRHFPDASDNPNELPNRLILI